MVGLLLVVLPLYAADVSDAEYIADIVAQNSGSSADSVRAVADINTQAFIDGGFVTSDLLNTALQTPGGTDIAYMPGVGDNPWALFIPSIGAYEQLGYVFYTGGPAMQTGFHYIPADGGMTTADSASLELGNNFEIELSGYIDTSGGDGQNLIFKNGAIQVYVSDEGEITVELSEPTTTTFYPDPHTEVTSVDGYANESTQANWATIIAAAGDNANDSAVSGMVVHIGSADTGGNWSFLSRGIYLFDTSSLPDDVDITNATFSVYGSLKYDNLNITPNVNVYASNPNSSTALVAADYANVSSTPFCDTPITYAGWDTAGYNDFALNAAGLAAIDVAGVSEFSLRNANYDVAATPPAHTPSQQSSLQGYFADQAGTANDPKLVVTYSSLGATVTVNAVDSGEHTITVTLSGGTLSLQVDEGDPETTAFAGSVPDTANDWVFLANGSVPYMEYLKITVSGVLKQHIVYERDTTFTDLSGNGNHATPTFLTSSSDPDVTVSLSNLWPIEEAELTGYSAEDTPEMLTEPPDMPPEMYTEGETSHLPGASVINAMLDAGGIPRDLFWIPLCYGIAAGVAVLLYHFVKSLLIISIVGGVIILFFALTGVIPLWTFLIYGVLAGGVLVAEKQLSW